MSAAAEAVRLAVTLEAVLNHYGHSLPQRGSRMACPIHRGRNASAFSIRGERFNCFNCGAHGDVVDLELALGGGTVTDAVQRLIKRHRIDPGRIDVRALRRRRRRLARLKAWWRQRSYEWGIALFAADTAVRNWQCDPAEADAVFWFELQRRCEARDIAEAMWETFRELRSVEQRASAFVVEQRGLVVLPSEVTRWAA